MRKGLDDTKNELKEKMEKGQEETKKGQEDLKNSLEKKIDTVEEKINSVEDKITLKVEEKIALVEENIQNTILIISDANGWTEGVEACQLAASLRGEAVEILQTLPDTERLNLNSLYNALDLRFSQKYSKDSAHLKMKTRLQKTGESLQEYASEVERLANLGFSDHPATVREAISLQYFVDGLKDREVQKAMRMADVQDLKSALLYALKLEAATQASRRDHQSIQGAGVTADEPCESDC
ncbi:uncharacterized protein TNCV_1495661 [Trichonephila clavipes]|nr:uncharacterized protein TNCV_1495661 [Trichonephila clavipes]